MIQVQFGFGWAAWSRIASVIHFSVTDHGIRIVQIGPHAKMTDRFLRIFLIYEINPSNIIEGRWIPVHYKFLQQNERALAVAKLQSPR